MKEYTRKIAVEMHVEGLMNMQYAIENGKVFVLEANPRTSRTVPLVAKVCCIRKAAIREKIPYITTAAAAMAAAKGLHRMYHHEESEVKSLQSLPSEIKDKE